MPAIVEYPTVVQDLVAQYGDLFANQPERRHFAEYLTGLYIVEQKKVSAINREFALTTYQSCLNRFLTEVSWDVAALNQRRLDLLQCDSSTRYSKNGVIAIDNTLIDHVGKLIADVGWFWDHTHQRHLIAHDYLIAKHVCTSSQRACETEYTIPFEIQLPFRAFRNCCGSFAGYSASESAEDFFLSMGAAASPAPAGWFSVSTSGLPTTIASTLAARNCASAKSCIGLAGWAN